MPDHAHDAACLNCGRTQTDVPLGAWQYQGSTLHICIDCMPVFIHEREQVMVKWLAGQQIQPPSGE